MKAEEKDRIIKEALSDINVSKIFIDTLIERIIKKYYLTKEKKEIQERIEESVINELRRVAKRFMFNVEYLELKRKEIANDDFINKQIKKGYAIRNK